MAIGLRRKTRLDSRRENQKITRTKNSTQKREERIRRDKRVIEKIQATKDADYSPEVKSWLSDKLGKSYRQITAEDVQSVLSA